jgi:hypothetical protein
MVKINGRVELVQVTEFIQLLFLFVRHIYLCILAFPRLRIRRPGVRIPPGVPKKTIGYDAQS